MPAPSATELPQQKYPLGYNPRLDGIRAIAALCVLFSHFGIPGFSSGLFGVDIFFVLSGYLITLVLANDAENGRSIGQFYWRRFLRLMPALATLSAVLFVIKGLLSNTATIRDDIVASIFYVSNWTRAFSLGTPMYLGNCWSLAVEEQFYLIWPIIFVFFARKRWNSALLGTALILLAASIVWRIWLALHGASEDRLFNGFDTHCDGLLLGCVFALSSREATGQTIQKNFARLWPIAAIGISFMVADGVSWTYVTGPIANLCAIILVLAAMHLPHSLLGRVLEMRPAVAIGKISYALYLWHYPIWLYVYEHFTSTASRILIGIPLSFLCAFLSYRFIEQPALRLRYASGWRTQRLGLATASLSLAGMIGASIFFFGDDIMQAVSPQPIVIESYGPHTLKRGEAFNVQPNGESWMWIKLSHSAPLNAKVRIGERLLKTNIQGRSAAALLPPDLRETVGKETLAIIGPDGKAIAPPVSFEITE